MDFNRKIAERAYELWVQRGRPHGTHEEDWLEAERQLRDEQHTTREAATERRDASLAETFPASDPPASRLPDLPPANAGDKWAAAARNQTPGLTPETAARTDVSPRKGAASPAVKSKDMPRAPSKNAGG